MIQIGAQKRTATVPGLHRQVRGRAHRHQLRRHHGRRSRLVADVNPLTDRTLSILGKRNGTTRVSVYAEGKKLIGVFDVEVVFDTTLIQSEIRKRFPHAKLRVTAVNGRIMLSGTSPDGADARPRGDDRQAVRPGRHQHRRGAGAAAGHAGGALHRGDPPGRAASSACSGTAFGSATLANIGNRVPAAQLPVTNTGGRHVSRSRASTRRRRPTSSSTARSRSRRSRSRACCPAPRRSASWSPSCS